MLVDPVCLAHVDVNEPGGLERGPELDLGRCGDRRLGSVGEVIRAVQRGTEPARFVVRAAAASTALTRRRSSYRTPGGHRPLCLPAERRTLTDHSGTVRVKRARKAPRALCRDHAGRAPPSNCRGGDARDRRRDFGPNAEAAHATTGRAGRPDRHHGMRRPMPGHSRKALRGLRATRPGGAVARYGPRASREIGRRVGELVAALDALEATRA